MSRRLKASLLALCVTAALTACDSRGKEVASKEAPTGSTETTPTVESSLEGITVLPSRIRWSATTSLRPEQVQKVRFIVDGDSLWVDEGPPYTYGPEGAYLATRWISSRNFSPTLGSQPDLHEFKVEVVATNGEEWSEITRALTPKANVARNAPGNFRGWLGYYGWGRLSAADLVDPPRGYLYDSYTGSPVFIDAALFSKDDHGEFAWEISSNDRRVHLGTPVYLDPAHTPATWYGYRHLNTALCALDGPPATYAWSLMQGRVYYRQYHTRWLHLQAVNEPCDTRRRMLEGIWEEITD